MKWQLIYKQAMCENTNDLKCASLGQDFDVS